MDILGYNSGMKSGIYQITNQLNGKRYIGSSVNLKKRWQYHLGDLRRGRHDNPHLQAAFKKYGESAFVFSVLERVEAENLLEHEQHYLDTWIPEYNILQTAGSPLGFRHTPEARAKMSAAMTGERNPNYGKHPSEETLAKLSAVRMGHPVSAETRKKMSEAHKGRRFSEEHRRKISEARKGKPLSAEHRRKISDALRGNSHLQGHHHSEETKHKMSAARKAYLRRVRASSE